MPIGTIKRVFKDRGFGFIRTTDGQEIFFHRSGLRSSRFESIAEGDAVEFEVESSSKGPRAVNIQVADKP
jgi:cold shock CspA family protein